jgi:S-methylmethionine-dependent homocysteine/selenocysteine methylase
MVLDGGFATQLERLGHALDTKLWVTNNTQPTSPPHDHTTNKRFIAIVIECRIISG